MAKYFLRPIDSVTNEWVVSQILVCSINTVHMSVVICDAFRYELSHIHDFTYKIFFIDCSQRQPTLTEHKDKHGFIISQCKQRQLDILKLLYKLPAYNDRSAGLILKSAIEKIDRLSSTLAILSMNY
jgi:hypothetical protein